MADTQRVLRDTLLQNPSDIAVAVATISVILMIIIPVPAVLLDTLLALNLTVAILIILIVLYTRKATEFSIFPTMLLVTTVFGLALNISSTRLILSKGANFDAKLIRAFASFVVGTGGAEGLVIGFVIFVVIIAVQAIVITKGSTRIAEVAARFTLDGLPGKQMAIEAEYNSGSISEEEAIKRKADVQREVDFYGQMDGASKFISGNVKVGIFIS
ncbi:MAG TPA: FHIPEP family type III secretion protein, partial [Spirochaetia bacterium]|nr:FHIPEP family type III secretion protein [Spirochaetia bacterium]